MGTKYYIAKLIWAMHVWFGLPHLLLGSGDWGYVVQMGINSPHLVPGKDPSTKFPCGPKAWLSWASSEIGPIPHTQTWLTRLSQQRTRSEISQEQQLKTLVIFGWALRNTKLSKVAAVTPTLALAKIHWLIVTLTAVSVYSQMIVHMNLQYVQLCVSCKLAKSYHVYGK